MPYVNHGWAKAGESLPGNWQPKKSRLTRRSLTFYTRCRSWLPSGPCLQPCGPGVQSSTGDGLYLPENKQKVNSSDSLILQSLIKRSTRCQGVVTMFCKSISTAPLGGNEMPSTQIYPSVTVPASAAAQIATGPRRLIACILVSASANSAVKFKIRPVIAVRSFCPWPALPIQAQVWT